MSDLNAVDAVRGFAGLRALVIGDAMLDTYLEGTATRLCKEGPVPVVRRDSVERAPGGAANAAANLAALGADVRFIGLIGADEAGQALRAELRARGVNDRWLIEDATISTLHKLRVVANGQYLVRFDEGETRPLSDAVRTRLMAAVEEGFARCDLVVASDYGYDLLSPALIERLRLLRQRRPCVLAVDAKEIGKYARAAATVVTPNIHEARLALEPERAIKPESLDADPETIARRLHDMLDVENVVVTMAGNGVMLVEAEGRATHLPAFPVTRAGDVGAGDSFTAAMALALASGASPRVAARIGVDAAAIAISQQRTSVVHHQDLLRRSSLDVQNVPGDLRHLVIRLDAERSGGKRIVFTNGVFDILHAGHVQLLKRAKLLGDILVVGVNSDASTRRLKGPTRPINRETDRLALVAALDPVDHAVLFTDDTPEATIRAVRPHIHVKGGDYTPGSLPEQAVCEEVGARIEILSLVEGRSTTGVIERIVSLVNDGTLQATP